jgi:hypothetical protein
MVENVEEQPPRTADRRTAWICHAAIVLAVVGVFGTWRSSSPVSLDGVQGPNDGWLVVIVALIGLAGVRALSRGSWLGIVTVLGSGAVIVWSALSDALNDTLGGSSGWGVWTCVAAGAVLAASAVLVAVRRVRPSGTAAAPV